MTFPSLHDPSHLYFVTASICGWKHLFTSSFYAQIVLDSLDWMRRNDRLSLYTFVLMPSHLHTIVKPKNRTIGNLIQEFGSFTAHAILKQLKIEKRNDLLAYFETQRRDVRHKHSIWQDIQAKNIYSIEYLRQKVEYIHNNPIGKQWRLVTDRSDYIYSSACFYDRGQAPVIMIDDVREWF